VFEKHLHTSLPLFLNFLQLFFIIIKTWIQPFLISSSPTSLSFLLRPHLPQISFYFQNRKCTEPPLQIEVHEIIFPMSHHLHETSSEQESCVYFTRAMQSVIFIMCSAQCFCHISLYGSSNSSNLDALES
jgi:hypothetical protein